MTSFCKNAEIKRTKALESNRIILSLPPIKCVIQQILQNIQRTEESK